MPEKFRFPFHAGLLLGLLLLGSLVGMAQSGRSARKPIPLPSPPAEPSPTPVATEAKKPELMFIVGMNRFNDTAKIPGGTANAVLRACANRLDDPEPVAADISSSPMNQADAVLRAKSENEAHVVWLRLRPNNISGAAGSNDPENLYLEFSVFAPRTGKEVKSGRVFTSYRARTVVLGPKVSTIVTEGYMLQLARDAANIILNHFHIRK